ncbi:MAG: glycosyltransferase family 4 protein [Eubacteriales bacterium]|nr:glycosyltransferase family 4 protein [Eubacteriales bacterium]
MKQKVLIIQQVIPAYRVPIFNLLAEQLDLTVAYESGSVPVNAAFSVMRVKAFRIPRVGKVYRGGLRRLTAGYDVVINSYDTPAYAIRVLGRLKRRNFGLVHWGIGVSASYSSPFDAPDTDRSFYERILSESDACLFYSDYPVEKYTAAGWPGEKLFVAPNTVPVKRDETPREKDSLLFLGSLYPQKGFDELLVQFELALKENPNVPKLILIGDGSERARLEAWVRDRDLNQKIVFTGAIFDDVVLGRYFASAIACVSPNQAGLTVLKSMGCGVPYITRRGAITGGELFNIEHGVNGVLYGRPEELKDIILDLTEHPETYMLYGSRARAYYEANRRPEQMARGFFQATEYARKQLEKRRGES